jgi:hypothetical protein
MAVMREPIKHGGGHLGITEHSAMRSLHKVGAVMLNPERDSIIKTRLAGNHTQALAA